MLATRTAHRALLSVLLAGTTMAVASPASAADTWATTTVASPNSTVIDFGDDIDIDVDIDSDSQSGDQPTEGTTTLYAMEATKRRWAAVGTSTAASPDFSAVAPRMTTSYKVVYHGHEADSSQDDSHESSESAVFTVEVARTITYPSGGFVLEGRVRPRYGNRPIVIKSSRSRSSGYVRHKAIRTDRRGRYSITLPRRKGTWYWTVKVKGDARYLPTDFQWETWVS